MTATASGITRAANAGRAGKRTAGPIVVGTRGSALALWQTEYVVARLRERHPDVECRIEHIRTRGDQTQALNIPLTQAGDKSMFVAELERALLAGADSGLDALDDRAADDRATEAAGPTIDLAVHSLKDLPSVLTPGLVLAAIPPREDPRDALVTRDGRRLADLPPGARVATSSLRRRAQLLHLRPDLRIVDIRGNVDTRVRKTLAADGPDGAVLAAAGLKRLGLEHHISEYFAPEVLVPAVGQGALAAETRRGDRRIRRLLADVDDRPTRICVEAERALLAHLGGGCLVPAGAYATLAPDGATIRLVAIVADPDGARLLRAEAMGPAARSAALGRQVAARLRRQGASAILRGAVAGLGGAERADP